MRRSPKWLNAIRYSGSDDFFRQGIEWFKKLIAKLLTLGIIAVILGSVWSLGVVLVGDIFMSSSVFLKKELLDIFGFFLTILIALELLENIEAYLRDDGLHLELVIAISLTAVARKIILLDLDKVSGTQVIGLAIAILTLGISFWVVRRACRER